MAKKQALKLNTVFAETAGWYGAIAIISAYALVSFDVVTSDSLPFQLLNLTGAMGVMIIAVHKRVKQSIVLNVFWVLVAIIAITRIIFV